MSTPTPALDVAGIAAQLNVILAFLDLPREYLVHDLSLDVSSSGRAILFGYHGASGWASVCGSGATICKAVADFVAKVEPRMGAAQRKRADAQKLLAEAAQLDADEANAGKAGEL